MSLTYQICRFLWNQPWFKPEYGRSVYKRICQEGEPPDLPFETGFFGLRYQGNLKNNIDFNVFYYGAFEKPLLFFLRDCLQAIHRSPSVFCDIGANIGQHSLFMSRVADGVHAFEPYDVVRQRLEQQVALNQLDNVFIHPVGLGETEQQLPFYAPTGRNQGIGSFDASTTVKGNRNIGELALVSGDSYFQQRSITSIDLIKIDVEGFEKSVLRGLQKTLAANRPVVVFEMTHGSAISIQSQEELGTLFPDNYRFFTFDLRKPDGSKARRREAKARSTGHYRLVPFGFQFNNGQDDIVCCPEEYVGMLPGQGDG